MSTSIEDLLFTIRYRCDTESHLVITDQAVCRDCSKPCLTFCPAEVYTLRDGEVHVAYENCVECGTCRIACVHRNIEWRYPLGGFGVAYKIG